MSNLEVRLNITNFNSHPENPNYTVFHFYREDLAVAFEELLIKKEIPYESFIEEEPRKLYLFGIKNLHYKQAVRANYEVIGRFREPFIPNKVFAIGLIAVVLLMIILAFIGFFMS